MRWQVQEAKQHFSELLRAAEGEPQVVTRHGAEIAVVVDIGEYRRLKGEPVDLMSYLVSGPHVDIDLTVDRHQDQQRDVDFTS